jgi:hypothetical protein
MGKRVYYWSVGGKKFASLQKAKEFARESNSANCRRITGHDKKGEILTFTPYEVTKRGISFKKTVKISVNDTIIKTDKQ